MNTNNRAWYEKPITAKAHIHSLNGEMDEIKIIGETQQGKQTVYIVEYKDVICTAIFNCFTCSYYADDIYGIYGRIK